MTESIFNPAHPLGEYMEFAEPGRVLIGSDVPMAQEIGMQMSIDGVERRAGGDSVQAVEGENAQTLFPRLAALR